MFEHVYDADGFAGALASQMRPGARLVFSLPNMRAMLREKHTNTLNFEHTVLLAEEHVAYWLAKHEFRLLEKGQYLDSHSLFFAAVREDGAPEKPLSPELYSEFKSLFTEYTRYYKSLVAQLNRQIESSDRPVYIFGAHVFSQSLFAYGLQSEGIVCVFGQRPQKAGTPALRRQFAGGITTNFAGR